MVYEAIFCTKQLRIIPKISKGKRKQVNCFLNHFARFTIQNVTFQFVKKEEIIKISNSNSFHETEAN